VASKTLLFPLSIALASNVRKAARMARLSALLCLLMLGCQASANAQVSANSQGEAQGKGQAGLAAQASPSASRTSAPRASLFGEDDEAQAPKAATPPALLGARAGLHLAKAIPTNCMCLAVAVGQPNDPRMRWDGQVSVLDSTSQLALALGSEGIDCPGAPKDALGGSYHGYEKQGDDVVVFVEVGRMGRPLASGAVVPKPADGGKVVVSPVDRKTPYGRSADGKAERCIVWIAPERP
jgi:hypothetical protein